MNDPKSPALPSATLVVPSSPLSDLDAVRSLPLIDTEAVPVAPIAVIPERSIVSKSALLVIVRLSIALVEIVNDSIDSLLLTVIFPS